MADDLQLVRVTARRVGYVWATRSEVERAVVGAPNKYFGCSIDGDALLALAGRVEQWADDYPTTDLVEIDDEGEPVGVEDWHDVPPRPEAVARG